MVPESYLCSKTTITSKLDEDSFICGHFFFFFAGWKNSITSSICVGSSWKASIHYRSIALFLLSDSGSSLEEQPLHMNDCIPPAASVIQYHSTRYREMDFYWGLCPGAKAFPQSFKSSYQWPTTKAKARLSYMHGNGVHGVSRLTGIEY